MDSERFNVEAKADGNPDQEASRRMVQALLTDRFHLALHRETREIQAYSLVPAKNGPRLTPARPGICSPYDDSSWPLSRVPDLPVCGFQTRLRKSDNAAPVMILEGQGVPMSRVATVLGTLLDHQVTDETRVGGAWDFRLEYADDRLAPGSDGTAPSLFSALQEQIGLKLESRKRPVEVLIIDHAERPAAN